MASLSTVGRNSLDDAGRLLVFPKFRRDEGELWVKDLTTGQERHLVTTRSSQLNPVISYDGAKVAHTVNNGGQAQGFVIPTAGGTARKVCDGCNLHGWFARRSEVWIAPLRPGNPPPQSEWVLAFTIAEGSAERACGWSPDGRLLYALLERGGFRDLYAQRIDPVRGIPTGEPFVVQHLHDPRRRWGSTPFGTAIVNSAFVFNQVEST